MAEIHAILEKVTGESDANFRDRCSDFLMHSSFPSAVANGAIAIGRMTLVDGKHLDPDMRWGQAHVGPLPDHKCIIASYTLTEARSTLYKVDVAQLRRAPVNPQTFPRLGHQMSMDEFSANIDYKKMPSMSTDSSEIDPKQESWMVFLDGVNLGFYKGVQVEAARCAHKEQVRVTLDSCTSPGADNLSILPSPQAIVWHPEFGKKHQREFALSKLGLQWTEEFKVAAQSEGWDIKVISESPVSAYRGIAVELNQSTTRLENIDAAWELIVFGKSSHHLVARTILATSSPVEYRLMMASTQEIDGNELQRSEGRML